MIAALPMYDRPETQAANDRLWALVRDHLRAAGADAPDQLTRTGDLWAQWQSPDLVLGQTCGLPFRARLQGKVALVASPDYGLEGCAPGYYRSVLVARASDARRGPAAFSGARLAYNDGLSQSGWGAVWEFARDAGFAVNPALETGAHRNSARAVAEGRAEWAALDALSWRLMQRWDDFAKGLTVIGLTRPTPALPYITAVSQDTGMVKAALAAAITDLGAQDRDTLSLRGVATVPASEYLAVPIPPAVDQYVG